jgi:alpha-glucosidase
MPYLYSAFIEASETGAPVQRPLIFDFQNDLGARQVDDQFLLGRDLLVAPIYRPGQTSRVVYLPPGSWIDESGTAFVGPLWISAPAPLDIIPIFWRGGSVVPMWPEVPQTTMGYRPRRIELHVFPPVAVSETRSVLHEDDGETFGFRTGACYRTEFTLRRDGNALTLDAAVSGGGYAEFARREFKLFFHGVVGSALTLDGHPASLDEEGCLLIENAATGFSLLLNPR